MFHCSENDESEEEEGMNSWFDDEAEEGEPDSDEQDMSSDEEEEEDEENPSFVDCEARESRRKSLAENDDSSNDSEEEQLPQPMLPGHLRWKSNLAARVKMSFEKQSKSLQAIVYEDTCKAEDESEEDEEMEGLFRVKKTTTNEKLRPLNHQQDTSCITVHPRCDWSDPVCAATIKHLFVTGSWGEDDATALLEEEEEESDEEEELERVKKKKMLKRSFDTDYDNEEEVSTPVVIIIIISLTPKVSYYDDLKQQMSEQAERNRAEFAGMDAQQRVLYEGYREGTYIRMEIKVCLTLVLFT